MIIETIQPARIKLLNPEIASQIAAGEVIERPASVLKELLENCIDAGATQISVSVQRGGIQLISVRDNGSGIEKDDLMLALQQHATSKIRNVNDLASIASLGFRGEALASINSVAKLTLTSRASTAETAWTVSEDNILPAAHPIGTTITVRDLFYNVPARRKFLRSERTEYLHLEEVFRRIALSNFTIGFSLKQQDKLVKNLLPCNDNAAQMRRLESLCGKQAVQQSLRIDIEQNGLRLWGWIGLAAAARSQEPHQYFFINQRVIRDRLINHAIREVYSPLCLPGKMPFYCLYLELDTLALDVNVHPTKHEVRFRDARIIHEFITQALRTSLDVPESSYLSQSTATPYKFNASNESRGVFAQKSNTEIILSLPEVLLGQDANGLLLVDVAAAQQTLELQGFVLPLDQRVDLLRYLDKLPEGRCWRRIAPQDILQLLASTRS